MRSSWPRARIGSKARRAALAEPQTAAPEPEAPEDDDAARGPLRRCLVTREQGQRRRMLRFAVSPGGVLVFDVTATLPGRGLWLSARAAVLNQAIRRGVFSRALRAPVSVPADLAMQVKAALTRRIIDLLGLARRSGAAVHGFEKAGEWRRRHEGALIVQAADGSAQERARFPGGRAAVAVLDAAALGRIFGREHVVHVAIAPGRLAAMIEIEAQRLSGVADGETRGQ